MSKRTRYFLLGAGAVLAVGLTTGLVASYIGLPVAFSRAAGPDELQYVPSEAAVVAYANVRDVMQSSFRERFRRIEPDTRERDEFEQKTGVNIEEDIESVIAAVMPGASDQTVWAPASGVLVLARGRFEPTRLEALALEHGGVVEDYQGKRLLTHPKKDGTESGMAVGFLEADLIALGSYPAVRGAIDAGGGGNIVSNTDMMRQINALEGSDAWAVGRFEALARAGRLPSELQAQVPAIQWFSAATQINGGLSGVFKAEARDEEAGQNLRDLLRGFLALAKMQMGARPELKAFVDSIQLTGDGKDVALSFTLPSELFDALEALSERRGQVEKQ